MGILNTGEIDIAYEENGPVDGSAVILIRGQATQLVHWPQEFYKPFADAGFRTVRFDNRDTGLSSKFDRIAGKDLEDMWQQAIAGKDIQPPYTLDDMVNDVLALMDDLNISQAHIVGISMGGVISQLLAARHGDRVRSLTSVMSASRKIDPALIADLWTDSKPREEAIEEWIEYMHTFGSKDMLADDDYYRQQAAEAYDRCYAPEGANRQILAICAVSNVNERVQTISVPTLVVHGAVDQLVPPEAGRQTAELIPNSKFKLIEGMGHDIPPALGSTLSTIILNHIRSAERL
jgi:pimeloyl-ACP methyl ester carboxylesterase